MKYKILIKKNIGLYLFAGRWKYSGFHKQRVKNLGRGGRVDSVSTYCAGGLPIKSRQPLLHM